MNEPVRPLNQDSDLGRAIAISSLIHLVSNRMTASGTMAYSQFGLGLLEARILYVLATSGPANGVMLSDRLGVDPAAISRSVNRLLAQRLLQKGPGPRRQLSLTPEGRTMAQRIAETFEERCFRLIEGLDREEQEALRLLLERLQANLPRVAKLTLGP